MPQNVGSHQRRKPLELPWARSPGKFEGELRVSEFVWDLSMQGYESAALGDVQDFGYYSLIHLGPGTIDDVAKQAREAGVELTPAERQFIRENVGAIAWEDNVGFVWVHYFDSKETLDQSWSRLEDEYADFIGEGEDE